VADIDRRPLSRHWEAPRRTKVDARNQPADKRKDQPPSEASSPALCTLSVGKQTLWGVPRGERSLLPQLLTQPGAALLELFNLRIAINFRLAVLKEIDDVAVLVDKARRRSMGVA